MSYEFVPYDKLWRKLIDVIDLSQYRISDLTDFYNSILVFQLFFLDVFLKESYLAHKSPN